MPPRARLRLAVAALLATGLLAGGWLGLRDSSLVAVRDVEITGLSGSQAGTIDSALRTAARELTTLHVRPQVLDDAATPYPAVASISAHATFPHKLVVTVRQRLAVAILVARGFPATPVAADGVLLRGATAPDATPTLDLRSSPAGERITDPRTRTTLRLIAQAPAALRRHITTAFMGRDGLTVHLRQGPVVEFGDGERLRAKWSSLAAVLASGQAAGATAIDVRVPERPAASGLEQKAAQIGTSTSG